MDGHGYTLDEVIAKGFEARCVGVDGARYLWHGVEGLKVDVRHCTTTMLSDPARLPNGPWLPTELGAAELGEG